MVIDAALAGAHRNSDAADAAKSFLIYKGSLLKMVKMASSKFLALKWSCSLGKNEAAVSCEKNFQKVKRKILKAYFATVFAVFGNNPACFAVLAQDCAQTNG
jgi:hypothetical protein